MSRSMNEQTAWVRAQESHQVGRGNGYAEQGPALVGSERIGDIPERFATTARHFGAGAVLAPLMTEGSFPALVAARWRFRWRRVTGPMSGVEMRWLRRNRGDVGNREPGSFGRAVDAGGPKYLRCCAPLI